MTVYVFIGGETKMRYNKKGEMHPGWIIGIIATLLVVGGYITIPGLQIGKGGSSAGTTTVVAQPPGTIPPVIQLAASDCPPNTLLTNIYPNVYNSLNTTSDPFDVTMRIYDATSGQWITTLTDTTNPSAYAANCGVNLEGRILTVDGAMGDNSIIHSASVDVGSVQVVNDDVRGSVMRFKTKGGSQTFTIQGERGGPLEFRSNDNILNDLDFNSNDASATDFELTGANFTSPTSNTSYTSVSSGQYLDKTVEFESATDTAWVNYFDQGGYDCLDHSTTTWKKPSSVTLEHNGAVTTLQDYKALGKLTNGEAQLFSNWEECYYIPAGEYTSRMSGKLRFRMQANTDPAIAAGDTDDVNHYFYSIGNYLSKDGFTLMKGAATDADSATSVKTRQNLFYSAS